MKEHTYNDTNNNNNDNINIKDTTIHKTKSETECNNNLPEIKRYETQKRKLTQKLKKNISQISQIHLNQTDITLPKYISTLQIDPLKRTIEDIALIKYYLDRTTIPSKLTNDGIDSTKHSKMITTIATYSEYKHYPPNTSIYEYLTPSKYIYIIIKGEVLLYHPIPMKKILTGNEYYHILIDLLHKKEYQILQAISYNNNNNTSNNSFYFDYNDIHLLTAIALKLHFQKEIIDNKEDFTLSFFEYIKLTPNDIGINDDIKHLGKISIIDKINIFTSKISNDKCKCYEYVIDNRYKREVTLFTFSKTKTIQPNEHFGDSNNINHNCNAITNDDTELCIINNNIYNEYINNEIRNSISKEIDFIYNNFFFKEIVKRKFEREYFHMFTKHSHDKGIYIFKEQQPLTHIYFIKDGTIELTSNKSIIETHQSINMLMNNNKAKSNIVSELYGNNMFPHIQSHPLYMLNQLSDKGSKRIFIVSKGDILGIDSVLHNIDIHLYSAKVVSSSASVYALKVNDLMGILRSEDDVCVAFENKAKIKSELMLNRLKNVKASALEGVERAIDIPETPMEIKYEMNMNNNNNVKQSEIYYKHKHINEMINIKKRGDDIKSAKRHRKLKSNNNIYLHSYRGNNDTNVMGTCFSNDKLKLKTKGQHNNNNNNHHHHSITTLPEITLSINHHKSRNNNNNNNNNNSKPLFYGTKSYEDRIFTQIKKQTKLIQQSLLSYSNKEYNLSSHTNNNNIPMLLSDINDTIKSEELFDGSNAFITSLQTIPMNSEHSITSSERAGSTNRKVMSIALKYKAPLKLKSDSIRLNKYSVFDSGMDYVDYQKKIKGNDRKKAFSNDNKCGIDIKGLVKIDNKKSGEVKSALKDIYKNNVLKFKAVSFKKLSNSNYKKHIIKKINLMHNNK
jgi:CRP-like cAMP-binding protein